MPFILIAPVVLEEDIRKSRFLVRAAPVEIPEQAQDFIARFSDLSATHNCWAWKIGARYRFHDDGEPTGTAGRPILNAIETQDFDQTVILVTRWFGGIKLGTGGLSRAYGGGASRCLQGAARTELIPLAVCSFQCFYSEWPVIESRMHEWKAIIKDLNFDGQGVSVSLALPESLFPNLQDYVRNLTRGRVDPEIIR